MRLSKRMDSHDELTYSVRQVPLNTQMKVAACIVALSLVGCAASPTADTGPVARCGVTDCFFERDIRDFEVVNRDTLVVYIGQQRCPFVVQLEGLDCDMNFSPQLHFLQGTPGLVGQATSVSSSQICSSTRGIFVYTGILDPSISSAAGRNDPITSRRTAPAGIARPGTGGFGDTVPVDATRDMCRVRQISSINDDQLLELYANEGVLPPPPPVGGGELEVPEEIAAEPAATPEGGEAREEESGGSAGAQTRR
jgi:hypothetical protein